MATKRQITAPVKYYFDWSYATISQIKKDIEELEKLGATDVEIEAVEEFGSTYVSISAYCHRLETDEEFNTRIEEEKKKEEQQRLSDLKEFERLKSKLQL